jgi:uncharacterized protein
MQTVHLPLPTLRRRASTPAPATPQLAHAFATPLGEHLLVANGSRVYDVPAGVAERLLQAAQAEGPEGERRLLAALGLDAPAAIAPEVETPAVNALALAVSEHCNLGCGYCYAEGGSFGQARAQHMPWAVAEAAVDRLLASVGEGGQARIAFMGGEPLLNRGVLRQTVEHATAQAARRGQTLQFAITSNATQLGEDDAAFLADHGFAVTISLDGPPALHDALRPTRGGGGSYERIVARLPALLRRQGQAPAHAGRAPMQASARVTVTPRHQALVDTLDHLIGLGFHSVGVAPSLSSQDPALQLGEADFAPLLAQMREAADTWEAHTLAGHDWPFSNMLAAMRELHRGTHRPFPCGAGAGYLGVAASGELAACHRFHGDPRAAMGHVLQGGIDDAARAAWLHTRHVDRQEPCRSCWARYLCGGGCHHEVLHRGRPACDFIRGWLEHVLKAYVRVSAARPELFA